MIITSDVKERLKKIRSGIVYSELHSVIDELLQNSQRAKATEVRIELSEVSLKVSDNGVGCTDPGLLFTLDRSGFGHGFGEGFTSVYMIADYLYVKSHDWIGTLNIEDSLNGPNEVVKVDIEKYDHKTTKGFEVGLFGEEIEKNIHTISSYIENAAAIIPDISIYLNGRKIAKRDIFDIQHSNLYQDKFNNRKYEGNLFLTDINSEQKVEVYFEYRFVQNIFIDGLGGVVVLKNNAVNLRTPDRKSIVYDNKRRELTTQLENDLKTLLKRLLRDGNDDYIKKFSGEINQYFSVEEYVRYLLIDSDSILNQYETREKATEKESETQGDFDSEINEESYSHQESDDERNEDKDYEYGSASNEIGNDADFQREFEDENEQEADRYEVDRDTKRQEADEKHTSFITQRNSVLISDKNKVTINNIKQKSNVVWVKEQEVYDYQELITEYEYYGVYTFVSSHILYDNALEHIGIPHISMLEEKGVRREYDVKKIGARSKKEERALEVLGMIEEYFNLNEVFNISTVNTRMIVELRGTRIFQKDIEVRGYVRGDKIHLNRKYIELGKLSSVHLGNKNLGIHDVKFVLSNISVISHELAHLLYMTKDNTVQHYEKQVAIQDKIAEFVLKHH